MKTQDRMYCHKCTYTGEYEEFEQVDPIDESLCETCPICGSDLVTYLDRTSK